MGLSEPLSVSQKPKAKFKIKAKAKQTAIDRVHQFANVAEAPEVVAAYDAIFGTGRPIDDLIATNHHLLGVMRPMLLSDFKAHLLANPSPVGRQVTRVAITPASNATISIPALRKVAKPYERAGIDVIATTRFRHVPFDHDPHGDGLSVELDALLFGPDAETKLAAKMRTARPDPDIGRSAIEWMEPHDTEAIEAAVKRMFLPNYTGSPLEDLFDDPPAPPTWGNRSEMNRRAYITFMTRAQLPLKYMFVLYGVGKSLLAHANEEARRLLKEGCRANPYVVHRDGLPHFFAAELRRKGAEIGVPLVMLR